MSTRRLREGDRITFTTTWSTSGRPPVASGSRGWIVSTRWSAGALYEILLEDGRRFEDVPDSAVAYEAGSFSGGAGMTLASAPYRPFVGARTVLERASWLLVWVIYTVMFAVPGQILPLAVAIAFHHGRKWPGTLVAIFEVVVVVVAAVFAIPATNAV